MKKLIEKVQKYYDDTKGTNFESMLEATRWFRQELPELIDELHDNEHFIQELERENMELRRQLRQDVKKSA